MPSIQSAKNAYIAKNQMELQQYQQLLEQQQHQYSQAIAATAASNTSNMSTRSQVHQNTSNNFKVQSKAIVQEISRNCSNTDANVVFRQKQTTTSIDESTTNAMSNDTKKYIKRGPYYGPVYDVDHLATFTVGSKLGLLKAEDGMRKLRLMEKSQGIWTMECQLQVDGKFLIVYDKKNGQEVEMFPLELVNDPTSVISDEKRDSYNNILLFTVFEDKSAVSNGKNKPPTNGSSSSLNSEMHIFQCAHIHSAEIVDEIYRAKEGRRNMHQVETTTTTTATTSKTHKSKLISSNLDENNNSSGIKRANSMQRASSHKHNHTTDSSGSASSSSLAKVDIEVQILNHCFDDIEQFVTRLQNAAEYFKELERRQKTSKSGGAKSSPASKHLKSLESSMLSYRAQMPPTQHFVDIFQKFKFSFNLLAKLKAHIHDPNGPELVHFLFTPLALIVNTTKEQTYRGLSKTVWQPLLTKDAKDLLLNCLTSKEQDLWLSLGDSWTITEEEAKLQPAIYGHLDAQAFQPVFYDGWSPLVLADDSTASLIDRLAFATAAQVQAQKSYSKIEVPIQKTRNYVNTQPQIMLMQQQPPPQQPEIVETIRGNSEMQKWAMDLVYRGAKVYEVTHDRQANNDKELTVKATELVEVLDNKRNWWRLRNFYGDVGHAPVTILRPIELLSINATNNNHSSHQIYAPTALAPPPANTHKSYSNGYSNHYQTNYQEQEKVGYFLNSHTHTHSLSFLSFF
jgi:epidermal growth factor receptor kinase substrate 8